MVSKDNTKRLELNRPGLFSPSVTRHVQEGVSNEVYLNKTDSEEEELTSLGVSSSFKYDPQGTGLRSTQQLNVDWSNFQNHVFFNSAQVKTNVAFDKIVNEYPFDGTKKEIELFSDELTGFEKWIYDQFPKNKGYLFFSGSATGGDSGTVVFVKDLAGAQFPTLSRNVTGESFLDPGLNSMTIETYLYVPSQSLGDLDQTILSKQSGSYGYGVVLETVTGSQNATVSLMLLSGTLLEDKTSLSVATNQWNHVAWVWDRTPGINIVYGFVDKALQASSSMPIEFGSLGTGGKDLLVGSGSVFGSFIPTTTFSGALDELRIWHSARTATQRAEYYQKPVYANDNLKLYFKFNEPSGSNSNLVLDYSNNSLHGRLNTTALNLGIREISTGSIAGISPMAYEFLSDCPVLFPNVEDSVSLRTELLLSASDYDRENPNLITKLVPPHYFMEGQYKDSLITEEGEIIEIPEGISDNPRESELGSTQVLLSLLYVWAKFFDELKLYIQAFSTLNDIDYDSIDTMPDDFLSVFARNEGIELPPLFTGASIPQFIEGQNLQTNISRDTLGLQAIRNQIWRRILINLQDVIKSKGTIHSIKAFIRSIGINPDETFRIREYGGPTKRSLTFARENRFEVSTMLDFVSGGLISTPGLSNSKTEPGWPNDGAGTLLHFSDVTFTNTSERYLLDPLNKQVLGPFAANVLATTTYQGRIYAQIEEARTNLFTYSQDLSHADWTTSNIHARTATTDPLSNNTAYKIIPDTNAGGHYILQNITPDGSSKYTMYVIAKAAGYTWLAVAMMPTGFAGNPICYFDLGNGVKGTPTDCDASDMVDLGSGWYLCSVTATSDAAGASHRRLYVAEADGDVTFTGNDSDGLIIWNPQFEIGAFPSSPIKTVAASVTRAKDQLYWASSLIPAAILSGRWALRYVPYATDTEEGGQFFARTHTTVDYIRYHLADNKFKVWDDGATAVASAPLDYVRNAQLIYTMDAPAGRITVSGATVGDGTYTDTPWVWASGENLWYGMNVNAASQINGLLSEPYDASGIPSDAQATSGSFTYEGIYRFPKAQRSFPVTQSLMRIAISGSGNPLLLNLVATSGSIGNRIKLYSRPRTEADSSTLVLEYSGSQINIFDGKQWYISCGRQRSDDITLINNNTSVSSSYFLRIAKQNYGEILESFTSSSFYYDGEGVNYWSRSIADSNHPIIEIGSGSIAPGSTNVGLNGADSPLDHRASNFNGKISQIRFWSKYLTEEEWPEHVRNFRSVGIEDPRKNFNFATTPTGSWERLRVDASTDQIDLTTDANGSIVLIDFSQNYMGFSGSNFPATSSVIAPERFYHSHISPKIDEGAVKNKVRIRGYSDLDRAKEENSLAWARQAPSYEIPPNEISSDSSKISIDFSVVDALDQDIITIFSSLDKFNNILGDPELQFAGGYKELEVLRDVYFNKLEKKISFTAFFEFYKWFDLNISSFVDELLPRKTRFLGSNYVLEQHFLERSRVQLPQEDHYLGYDIRSGLKTDLWLQIVVGELNRI